MLHWALDSLLGPWPQATLPGVKSHLVERREGYVLERTEYDVEPGERVAALMLVPTDTQPRAALLCHHQHGNNWLLGKSEVAGLAGDPDQAVGAELARRGYLVLAPDAIGFEDRNLAPPSGITTDREAAQRLVVGSTLLAKVIHDVKVGLDVLEARMGREAPLGIIGHSYGGRMAIWTSAFDARINAAVSHCGAITYRDHLRLGKPIQPEFVVPGIMRWGDLGDVAGLAAAPLLLSGTADDSWSPSTVEVYEVARQTAPVTLRMWPGKHVFTPTMRRAAYAFLDQHLL